jgi:hypothetical protein
LQQSIDGDFAVAIRRFAGEDLAGADLDDEGGLDEFFARVARRGGGFTDKAQLDDDGLACRRGGGWQRGGLLGRTGVTDKDQVEQGGSHGFSYSMNMASP